MFDHKVYSWNSFPIIKRNRKPIHQFDQNFREKMKSLEKYINYTKHLKENDIFYYNLCRNISLWSYL